MHRLALSWAANLEQDSLDSPPKLCLLLFASILKGGGLLSDLRDGFGALCLKKVTC